MTNETQAMLSCMISGVVIAMPVIPMVKKAVDNPWWGLAIGMWIVGGIFAAATFISYFFGLD